MKKISIVIPSYNELTNYKSGVLKQIIAYLKKTQLDWEVIIVDDGSNDGSNFLIKKFVGDQKNWHFIQNDHQGKTNAIKTGVFAAKNPLTLFSDFDQSTPIKEVEKLIPFTDQEFKIVIGSREVKGAHRDQEPWYRHLMGKGFNFGVQLVAVRGIQDTQCGFKLFDTKVARELFNSLKIYQPKKEKHAFTGAFDVELLFIANKRKIKIVEVPVNWKHSASDRVRPIRDSLRMAFDVIRIRLTDFFGGYKQI